MRLKKRAATDSGCYTLANGECVSANCKLHGSTHKHRVCVGCIKTTGKWLAIAYAAHWVLHLLAFIVSPTLGAILMAVF